MIVRTYGRRKREGIGRTLSGSTMDEDVCENPFRDPFAFSEEDYGLRDEQSPQQDYTFTFCSQDSTRWTWTLESDSCPHSGGLTRGKSQMEAPLQLLAPINRTGGVTAKKSKKVKNRRRGNERISRSMVSLLPEVMATLMETQEYGEMMELVDEVNFSLDGLKKGRPVLVKRGSLLSLLTICGDPQHRTLLRARGISKDIIHAIVGLSLDDPPSNLAAAALFYVLTSDGHDNHLLDSDSSIDFHIRLLKPLTSDVTVDKVPSISRKLLALRRISSNSVDSTTKLDSSANAISDKVKEILVNSKDIETGDVVTDGFPRPELSAKWIALLIIEKACFSTISLEDGTVRKTVGNFKETLRERGGLDAVFELAIDLHSTLKDWFKQVSSSSGKLSHGENVRCLVLLLRCLRIMENATFLSKENQSHLLDMRKYLAKQKSSVSFSKLMINFVNVLSDLSLLRRNSSTASSPEMLINISSDSGQLSGMRVEMPINISSDSGQLSERRVEMPINISSDSGQLSEMRVDIPINISSDSGQLSERRVESGMISSLRSSLECSSSGRVLSETASMMKSPKSNGLMSSLCSDSLLSSVEGVPNSIEDDLIITQLGTSKTNSCSTASRSSQRESSLNDDDDAKMKSSLGKRLFKETGLLDNDDHLDPFAFEEEECVLSKWDLLRGRKNVAQKRKNKVIRRDFKEMSTPFIAARQDELEDSGSRQSSQTSCSSVSDEESSSLLSDCLLTSVKVLMNLTCDNDSGCQQIAACGGLETLSSLIVTHFPTFGSTLNSLSRKKDCISLSDSFVDLGSQTESAPFSDHEIDFLVAILGVLVNLVAKNDDNRSRLASASILLPSSTGLSIKRHKSIIPLLCAIFLANQGAGEPDGERNNEPWDDEVALLQGEKEAEKMIIEAYAALLLAFLSTESERTREAISNYLPKHNLKVFVPVLERFVVFHVALDMISSETQKIVNKVIESCKTS